MRSEVKSFGLVQVETIEQAVQVLGLLREKAKVIAGGTDVLYLIKNDVRSHRPEYLVDISKLPLKYIRFDEREGLRIGALTTLSEVASHGTLRERFTALAQAADRAASPQLRTMATIGGDILQEVWCWYLRNNYDCWRNGGTICYGAIGDNRFYHSIFGGRLCYAVHAGDIAPALFAFNARVVIVGPTGEKVMSMDDFMPGITIVEGRIKENVLKSNELLKEIMVPTPRPGTKSAFYKIADRGSIDFALASAAVVVRTEGSEIADASIVLGAVDVKPRRARAAEEYLRGRTLNEETIKKAAEEAVKDATPLTFGTGNAFRVELAKAAVVRALRAIMS
ncbi:MAG: FAD binding domain-containing protein [Thermosphaera sp.]